MGVGLQPQREAIWVHIAASPHGFLPPSSQKERMHVLKKMSAVRGKYGRMHVEFKDNCNKAIRHGVQLRGVGRQHWKNVPIPTFPPQNVLTAHI